MLLPQVVVLAYVGPDQLVPVASAAAAIVGFVLLSARFVADRAVRTLRRVIVKRPPALNGHPGREISDGSSAVGRVDADGPTHSD